MRISDWSSDVCSSDLVDVDTGVVVVPVAVADRRLGAVLLRHVELGGGEAAQRLGGLAVLGAHGSSWMTPLAAASTEENGRRPRFRPIKLGAGRESVSGGIHGSCRRDANVVEHRNTPDPRHLRPKIGTATGREKGG